MSALLNEVRCSFFAISENESFARSLAVSFTAQASPTVTQLADIKCAVSEAVTNCIVHAYPDNRPTDGSPDKPGLPGSVNEPTSARRGSEKPTVEMILRRYADSTVAITIKDRGVGIPDIKAAREPLFTTDATGERSGMGFAIMESLMDNVRVSSRVGKGTTVTLKLRVGAGDR